MTEFLLLATILLAVGVVAVPIATRLGLGSVLGYLIAGMAISPALETLGVDVIALQHFAEFGVVMMLFLIGRSSYPALGVSQSRAGAMADKFEEMIAVIKRLRSEWDPLLREQMAGIMGKDDLEELDELPKFAKSDAP